jgi:hypothetical protein
MKAIACIFPKATEVYCLVNEMIYIISKQYEISPKSSKELVRREVTCSKVAFGLAMPWGGSGVAVPRR